MLRFSYALPVTISLLPVPPALAAKTATAPVPAALNGFRSAQFGIDETLVRHTIATDFNLPATAIHAGKNPIQRG